ncbi:hypothetical protein C7S15_1370 [Burkholderia cepacia]|nr:hypothetical protein [Burkholderia cepacia]
MEYVKTARSYPTSYPHARYQRLKGGQLPAPNDARSCMTVCA